MDLDKLIENDFCGIFDIDYNLRDAVAAIRYDDAALNSNGRLLYFDFVTVNFGERCITYIYRIHEPEVILVRFKILFDLQKKSLCFIVEYEEADVFLRKTFNAETFSKVNLTDVVYLHFTSYSKLRIPLHIIDAFKIKLEKINSFLDEKFCQESVLSLFNSLEGRFK